MKKQLLTIILILMLLVSWIVCHDLYIRNRDLSNALEIAEKFMDESREEIEDMSNQIDNLIEDMNRGNDWNKETYR